MYLTCVNFSYDEDFLSVEDKFFRSKVDVDSVLLVLKLPWTHPLMVNESHPPWKAKCLSLQILSKMGPILQCESDLEILDLGLHDEAEEVRIEVVNAMPVIILWSGRGILTHIFKRLEFLGSEKHEQIKKTIPLSLGYLACLYGSFNGVSGPCECKLFLGKESKKHSWTESCLLRGFWCSKCDKNVAEYDGLSVVPPAPDLVNIGFELESDFADLLSLFFKLLYDESSEEVPVACVGIMRRILVHGTKSTLLTTRSEWIKCIDFLLLH
ncbi:hypothetical protein RJ639_017709 [Escallonia herrerae]|uniref:Uncharacterized protein n=1 Tax=Escallonia herrerae TaxID=1293975 RepID=A0AA89AJU6_9ASTE|nr:hypothetical protein RJ639_021100 [Escallonia herrerae]KAK3006554.1 hypothetical protein RJ639_017709 [Escallonia herrerae]